VYGALGIGQPESVGTPVLLRSGGVPLGGVTSLVGSYRWTMALSPMGTYFWGNHLSIFDTKTPKHILEPTVRGELLHQIIVRESTYEGDIIAISDQHKLTSSSLVMPFTMAGSQYLDAYPHPEVNLALGGDGKIWYQAHAPDSSNAGFGQDASHLSGQASPPLGETLISQISGYTFQTMRFGWGSPNQDFHACAIGSVGLYCWGANGNSQVVDSQNGTIKKAPPTLITVGVNVTVDGVSLGGAHTCAHTKSNKVFCWGSDVHGAVTGTPSESDVTTPTEVMPNTVFGGVACGGDHTCAFVAGTGQAYCWGDNARGQLGNGTVTQVAQPQKVSLSGVSLIEQIEAGEGHTCIRHDGGQVTCWGSSDSAQVGDGSDGYYPDPVMSVQREP
jgi:hypothetical protein